MIYPTGHPIHWRPNIPPRQGSQTGTLTQDWHRYNEFPRIRWDGETTEQPEYPECVMPVEAETKAKPVVTTHKNAWDEYKPEKARVR